MTLTGREEGEGHDGKAETDRWFWGIRSCSDQVSVYCRESKPSPWKRTVSGVKWRCSRNLTLSCSSEQVQTKGSGTGSAWRWWICATECNAIACFVGDYKWAAGVLGDVTARDGVGDRKETVRPGMLFLGRWKLHPRWPLNRWCWAVSKDLAESGWGIRAWRPKELEKEHCTLFWRRKVRPKLLISVSNSTVSYSHRQR